MNGLEGMYDFHVHPAPSIQTRRFTALEALKLCDEERMSGIVFLDHTYNTTMVANTINQMGYRAKAYGTIILNEAVGGVSPSVVETALAMGTKQIQMPTYSSKGHKDAYGDDQKLFPYKKRSTPICILDERRRLISEVEEILEIMEGSSSFLASGHLSTEEIDVLVNRVKELKINFVANSVSMDMPGYPLEYQKKWAGDHVFMEHAYAAITDAPHKPTSVASVAEQIRLVGAERCILGTDSGSMKLPGNIVALKEFITRLVGAGITDRELDHMARRNPRYLLEAS